MRRPCRVIVFTALIILVVVLSSGSKKSTPTTTTSVTSTTTPAITTTTTASPSTTVENVDGQAVVKRINEALEGIKTYTVERIINSNKASLENQHDRLNIRITSNSLMDVAGKSMQMNNFISAAQAGYSKSMVDNAFYIKDDILYIQGMFPQEPQTWKKTTVPALYWETQNLAFKLQEMVKGREIKVLPPENVDDKLCDVITTTPELEQFWAFMSAQPGVQIPNQPPSGVSFNQIVKTAEIKIWSDRSSGLPLKATLYMAFKITSDMVYNASGDISMSIDEIATFRDYDQGVSIVVPEEALNASELNLQQK